MQEEWKDIVGYTGNYKVSNFGRIKSIKFNKEKIIKPVPGTRGYLTVGLFKNGECKKYLIHRLVAEAFLENENNYPQVNHIDEDKENNIVSNLEWCTNIYNSNYGNRNSNISKTRIERMRNGSIKNWQNKKVIQFLGDVKISEFDSIKEAGIYTKSSEVGILKCCKGRRKTCNGYNWRYKLETIL